MAFDHPFTTRPEIRGRFGVVTSTHWIASAVGMAMLERGGNAFDAAVATGFVLQVVEPHLNGPGGDMPAIIYDAATERTRVLCGQGPAPAGATIAHYRGLGLDMVPGSGLLATVIPGAFDAWMLMLRDHGTLELRDVLEPAIHYARHGHPVLPRVAHTIAGLADYFRTHWPSSAETWLPGGNAPLPHADFANPVLAQTWERLLIEAGSAPSREARIEAARRVWSQGFIAERIDTFLREAEVMDVTERAHKGVLTGADMAGWQAHFEAPASRRFKGWEVFKTGAWGQGPALLQALAMLEGCGLEEADPGGPEFVHAVTEAIKLAFADREAYYGDPDHAIVPLDTLLGDAYAARRRALIEPQASLEQRPGEIPGFHHQALMARANAARGAAGASAGGAGAGEPTMAHLTEKRGDTVHLDIIDRHGNMVSATPSGGWLQSSPVVPGLGFALNTRAQMFWLEEGLPTSLAPGRRPRTTLSPSLAIRDDGTRLAFGTPGGDQQDQWQLVFFLRHVLYGEGLQQAIDAPLFHSGHFQESFYPRNARPGHLVIEDRFAPKTIADLRARGHRIEVAGPWSVGRLTAARREPDGRLRAAATPRLMQAYAVGR